jgi:hypothetical protein
MAVAILVVAGGVGLFLMMVQRGAWVEQAKEENEALVHDLQNARRLVTALLLMREIRGRLPMKDGLLDLYSLKDAGISPPITYEQFTSMRSEVNPSRSDVESGNHDRLPWDRYSGGEPVDGLEDIPLIWERRPDTQGRVIVGLLSGSVQVWDHADLRTVLESQRADPEGASAD